MLEGRLHLPGGLETGGVVLCHPHPAGGGDKDVPLLVYLAQKVAAAGMACLRFDFGGVAGSSGDFTDGAEEPLDAAAAWRFLSEYESVERDRVALAGWSFGAWMAIHALADGVPAFSLEAIAPPLNGYRWDEVAFRLAGSKTRRHYLIGDRDQFCPVDVLLEFTKAVSPEEPERVTVLEGADHFLVGWEEQVAYQLLNAVA